MRSNHLRVYYGPQEESTAAGVADGRLRDTISVPLTEVLPLGVRARKRFIPWQGHLGASLMQCQRCHAQPKRPAKSGQRGAMSNVETQQRFVGDIFHKHNGFLDTLRIED